MVIMKVTIKNRNVMKRKIIMGISLLFISTNAFSQVGINTIQPHLSAALEVAGDDKGFLPPRIALKQITDSITIKSPAAGLLIYNTSTAGNSTTAVVPGYYYWSGNNWTLIGDARNTWGTTGNSNTDPYVNFIGTTDNSDLIFKRAGVIAGRLSGIGIYNTSFGTGAYKGNTGLQGRWNTAIGFESLKGDNGNMIAHDNTAVGSHSLTSNYDGAANTAIGFESMKYNTSGKWNVGVGYRSLAGNKTGYHNIAIGTDASANNPKGVENTAVGFLALANQTNGTQNVTLGAYAGTQLFTGDNNVIIGTHSAVNQSSGSNNIAIGSNTELKDTSGNNQLNIGNSIYGNSINAGVNTYANIGINISTPGNSLEVKSAQPNTSGLRLTNLRGANRLGTNSEGDIIEVQSSVKKINASYIVSESDEIVLADASISSLNLILPPSSQKGRKITIKKTDASSNNIVIQSSSQIDGQNDITVNQPYSSILLLDDGIAYWIIGKI